MQDGDNDEDVGNHREYKGTEYHRHSDNEAQRLDELGVPAGNLEKGPDVTVVMVDHVGTAEGQPQHQKRLQKNGEEPPNPDAQRKLEANPHGHKYRVSQGMADSQVSIKGHHREDEKLGDTKKEVAVPLSHAAVETNGRPC